MWTLVGREPEQDGPDLGRTGDRRLGCIMDAILGADPETIKEHRTKRRRKLVRQNVRPTTTPTRSR
jgi:hypothetical protein